MYAWTVYVGIYTSGTALKLHACTHCSKTNDSHLAPVVKTLGMENAVGFPKTLASQADVLRGSSRRNAWRTPKNICVGGYKTYLLVIYPVDSAIQGIQRLNNRGLRQEWSEIFCTARQKTMDCIKNVQHLEYTFFLLIFVTFQLHSRTKIAAYMWRLLENFKGENSLVLATRQVHLFGRN